jgi:hypothetical protein
MKIKIDLETLLDNVNFSNGTSSDLLHQIALGLEKEVDKVARVVSKAHEMGIIKWHVQTSYPDR